MFRLRTIISLFATGATLALAAPANAAVHQLTATLNGAQEVPAVTTNGMGTGTFSYDDQTNILTYTVTFNNLSSAVSLVHFHGPAAAGATAGPIITVTDHMTPIEGTTRALTAGEETDLLAGRWYFNIHTANFGNGEIRGQILRQPGDGGTDGSGGTAGTGGTGGTTDAGPDATDAQTDAPSDGAGGTAGSAGTAGTGGGGTGGTGTGGTAGSGGRGGASGAGGRGGASGAGGRGGASGSGGRGGTAGTGSTPGPADDDDGCGCRTAGGAGSSAGLAGLAFAGLLLSRRIARRRSQRG